MYKDAQLLYSGLVAPAEYGSLQLIQRFMFRLVPGKRKLFDGFSENAEVHRYNFLLKSSRALAPWNAPDWTG
jgi:hypothetical protein